MGYALFSHQKSVLKSIRPGSILVGGVGSGKTIITLAYYYKYYCRGTINPDGSFGGELNVQPVPLYVITTAYKRDSKDWELEASRVGIPNLVVDSWNNIKKYNKVQKAFFIFDEDKVGGNGTWAKEFIKIARQNYWILATATPGDTWSDYASVFIAKGYYRNFTEFNQMHVVFVPYIRFPKVHHYVNTPILAKHLRDTCVYVKYDSPTTKHYEIIPVEYDQELYKDIMRTRWDSELNEPIRNASRLCSLLRKVSNNHPSRLEKTREIIQRHKRVVIFYNFDYELKALRSLKEEINYGEYNAKCHDPIPLGDEWVYVAHYNAWAEGGNCTSCNCILFFSMPYSYKSIKQAAGRIDRVTTKFTDLYYYLLTSKSQIDNAILSTLKVKKKFNEKNFVDAL